MCHQRHTLSFQGYTCLNFGDILGECCKMFQQIIKNILKKILGKFFKYQRKFFGCLNKFLKIISRNMVIMNLFKKYSIYMQNMLTFLRNFSGMSENFQVKTEKILMKILS